MLGLNTMCAHALLCERSGENYANNYMLFRCALLERLQGSKCIGGVLDAKAVGRVKREQRNSGIRKGIQKVIAGLVFQAISATPTCAN